MCTRQFSSAALISGVCRIVCTLIATGQDPKLDPDLVREAYDLVIQGEERYRQSAAFGEGRVADPGEDASIQARLLAILGRKA